MAEVVFTWGGQSASFSLDDLTFDEAGEIERVTGDPLHQFAASLKAGFVSALRVAAWVAFKREREGLRLADFGSDKLDALTYEVVEVGEAPTPEGGRGEPSS